MKLQHALWRWYWLVAEQASGDDMMWYQRVEGIILTLMQCLCFIFKHKAQSTNTKTIYILCELVKPSSWISNLNKIYEATKQL